MGSSKQPGIRTPVRVFVSHSSEDQIFARKIRNLLVRRTTAQVFTTEDLSAGERWEAKLRNELTSASIVLAVLSPTSANSKWVGHELGAAWALGKLIVPIVTRRDVLNELPISLGTGSRIIELSDVDRPENADKLISAFEEAADAARMPRTA